MTARILVGLLVLAAALAPLYADNYMLYLLSLICAYGLIASGLNILMGSAGLVSLGHAGFAAVGAYTTGAVVDVLGAPYFVGILSTILVCGALGLLIGFPAIRLKGFYLAIATLAFGIGIERIIYSMGDLTGGPYGLSVSRPSLFGYSFDSDTSLYYLTLAAAVAGALLLHNVMVRRPGRMIVALRDDELAAVSMGVNATRMKVSLFAISAVYSGIGGALYGALIGFISTEHFTLWLSISFVAMIVIGGLGSILGAFLGAAFVVMVPEVLRDVSEYQQIVYGLSMILIFMLWPTGLIGAARLVTDRIAGLGGLRTPAREEAAR